jgi:hypothetical protein
MAFDPSTPNVAALYRRAELCGAKCVSKVDTGVTHLVAPGDTDLGQFAKALGVLVVHARWLELCDHNWSHVVEEPYFVCVAGGAAAVADAAPQLSRRGLQEEGRRGAPALRQPAHRVGGQEGGGYRRRLCRCY